jgi:hypothetical protein
MNSKTKLTLVALFVFAVGIGLVFVGAGSGRLGAFCVGWAIILFAHRLLALAGPR